VYERYKPLAELLSKELNKPVKIRSIEKYAELEKDLTEERVDLAFIHPAHIGLRAIAHGNYFGLCSAKGFTDYRARVLVAKDSPLKTLQDLKGKKIGVPSMESITTTMFIASLRQMNITQPEKSFTATRYQDAVPFMVENGFVDAGVTGSSAVEASWKSKGGRVLGETKPIPIKQFLASQKINSADRLKIQNLLISLPDNKAGKAALAKIGMTGFVPWNAEVMKEAATRLGI
jgi:ABC-type phosphate/phosphonate transport system substrate-binding protein